MSYSNNLKIHEIEPVYATPNRAEFRLPGGKLYTNNIHLANLGVTKSAATAGIDGDALNKLVGVYGSIKQISIMDGNVELQVLTRANEWLAFKQHLHSNSYNEDIAPSLCGNRKSNRMNNRDTTASITSDGGTTPAAPATAATTGVSIVGSKIVEGGSILQRDPTSKMLKATEGQTYKGQLDLAEALSFVQSVPYLDTEYFKNLKVVVEFNQDMSGVVRSAVLGGGMTTGNLGQIRPFLICEEITTSDVVDNMLGKTPKPFSYKVIENDVFRVPEITAPAITLSPAIQSQTYHVSSFNNKSVGRCCLMTRTLRGSTIIEGTAAVMYGPYNSHAMYHQKNQVRINGRNLFARDGITKENQRLGLMADTWGGNATLFPFQNGIAFVAADADKRSDYIECGNEGVGTADYFGFDLDNNVVSDLQLDYERKSFQPNSAGGDGDAVDSKYNTTLDLVMFAEVNKTLIPKADGTYNVLYAT